jgi:RecG-like helicase
MAPTEVLAEQHYRTVCRLLSGEPEPPITGLVRGKRASRSAFCRQGR